MDISEFRDRPTSGTMTVSELNNYIKGIFESNRVLAAITVRGEISNLKKHSSGHLYFSLKDGDGQIRAVMFRSNVYGLKFAPENGMKVTVRGSVSVYTKDGSYQLYATGIQPDGIGALYLQYEQMKSRLADEGLFSDRFKIPIPRFPKKIGVITSPTGAAVRDIINVLGRRYPIATVYLYPTLVQGDGAEESLLKALDYFDNSGLVDTIIIGRGGGSIEDLWAFNGEKLARRIFACKVPVISAVGHETDFTICDFVSDLRAPTPSAAAELAVPDVRELVIRTAALADRCDSALLHLTERRRAQLERTLASRVISSPYSVIEKFKDQMVSTVSRLALALRSTVAESKHAFLTKVGKLEALSPLAVLSRGYAVVTKNGAPVLNTDYIELGDDITVRVDSGEFSASVTNVESRSMN